MSLIPVRQPSVQTHSVQIGVHWPQADLDLVNRMSGLSSQFPRIHITILIFPILLVEGLISYTIPLKLPLCCTEELL